MRQINKLWDALNNVKGKVNELPRADKMSEGNNGENWWV